METSNTGKYRGCQNAHSNLVPVTKEQKKVTKLKIILCLHSRFSNTSA